MRQILLLSNSGTIALRFLCVFLAALSCHGAVAQTPTANYVKTETMLTGNGSQKQTSLQRGDDTPAATYTHNIRGWLKNLNDVGFWERILYTYNEIIDGGDSYTGNIGNLMWRNQKDTIDHNYCFYYDGEGRLDGAYYSAGADWTEDMDRYNLKINSYDLNGNILSLRRNGRKSDGSYGLTDDLTMSYVGNRLIRVVDAADPVVTNGSMDFKDGADTGGEYTYNASGALTSDLNKGISGIDYDINGNMSKVTFSNGNTTEYVYSQSGAKQRVIHGTVTALPFAEPGISTAEAASVSRDTTEYIGDFVFRNGVLDRLLFRGGYMDIAGSVPRYHYFATDHLGSVRTVYGEDGVAEQLLTYDLFGGIIPELSTGMGMQPYGYNGKELDHTHGLDWYDYGARHYDSPIGRWTTMDPLCEKYYNISPYVYCLNNPMRLVDYKGMAPGDFFLTVDKAAIDFGLYYNDNSIRERTEYGSTIIKVVNKKGQKGYTYTVANRGDDGGVICSKGPWGYKPIAEIHTHGHCSVNDPEPCYDNDFSGMPRNDGKNIDKSKDLRNIKNDMDIGNANERQRDSYLVTPNGSLKKYSPKTGKVTLISEEMPSDYHDSSRVNNKSSLIETNPIKMNTEFLQQLKILTYGHY